jgi:hypothetical protein
MHRTVRSAICGRQSMARFYAGRGTHPVLATLIMSTLKLRIASWRVRRTHSLGFTDGQPIILSSHASLYGKSEWGHRLAIWGRSGILHRNRLATLHCMHEIHHQICQRWIPVYRYTASSKEISCLSSLEPQFPSFSPMFNMARSLALALSLFASQAAAHTFIWGVYVNGVDQGTFNSIRVPAYNGAPGKGGYNNGPVKDLTSIDMRCNVMGDIPTSDTIKVVPGDSLTFDWYFLNYPS